MQTNPAQRLHDVLDEFKQLANNRDTVGAVWAQVLNAPEKDLAQWFRALSEVAALPGAVDRQLRQQADVDPSLFIEPWKSAVLAALDASRVPANPSVHVSQHYNEMHLLALRHASHALRLSSIAMPDPDDLPDLFTSLSDLEESVFKSKDLPQDVAEFLLRHIEEMKRALRLLRLTGPEGVRSAIAGSVGEAVLRNVEGKPLPDPESPVGKKWSSVMTKMGQFVDFSNGAVQLGTTVVEGAAKMLPG